MVGRDRLQFQKHAAEILQSFGHVEEIIAASNLDAKLRHLVKLRASQINGCAYCVGLHTSEARTDGETNERLDRVVIWREVDDFSPTERAALAWTEALTRMDSHETLDSLETELKRHLGQPDLVALTAAIVMINVWNRLQVASHGGRQLSAA